MRKGNSSQQDSHFGVAMRRVDEAEAISLMESLRERRGVAPSIDAPLAAGAAWGGSPDFSAGRVMSASVNRMKSIVLHRNRRLFFVSYVMCFMVNIHADEAGEFRFACLRS